MEDDFFEYLKERNMEYISESEKSYSEFINYLENERETDI